jgi:hypothetical protein
MAIIFRTAGPWGPGQGTNLAAATVDNNFWELLSRLAFLEDHPERAISIDYFSVLGTLLTVHMTDHSIRGPFELPVAEWRFHKEGWQSDTDYVPQDVLPYNGSIYLVLWPHHSAGSFDPGANDGMGHDFYGLLLADPGNALPFGGDTGDVLTKRSAADFDMEWRPPPSGLLPPHGAPGQALRKDTFADFDASWQDVIERVADLLDVALTSPLEAGDGLAWDADLGRWTNKPQAVRSLTVQISEADLIAGMAQRLLSPGAGTIIGFAAVVQENLGQGGTVDLKINGVAVTGSTLTFFDGDLEGMQYSATPSANNNFFAGDEIRVTPAGFDGTGAAGAVNATIIYV